MQPRVSFKFEIRQQQCCIVCIQVQFRANKMTHDLNTAFLCYASRVLLSCCTVEVTHRHKSRLHRHSPSSRIRIVLLDIEEEGIRNVSRSMYRARCRRLSTLVQHIPLRCAACLSVSSLCLSVGMSIVDASPPGSITVYPGRSQDFVLEGAVRANEVHGVRPVLGL